RGRPTRRRDPRRPQRHCRRLPALDRRRNRLDRRHLGLHAHVGSFGELPPGNRSGVITLIVLFVLVALAVAFALTLGLGPLAIAEATERIPIGTGVTCPTMRIHPAIVAHAAATTACLLPGRFFLGIGSGENLNEHVLGDRWPSAEERLDMLEEAVAVIRELWEGGLVTRRGKHYTVDRARLYTVPEEPPPIAIAAAAANAAELAGRIGDALIATAPDPDVVKAFDKAGGKGKPKYGQFHVCVA